MAVTLLYFFSILSDTPPNDLVIVAEGIEREEELNFLNAFKEHVLMQGFLICHPKGKDEFIRWAESWTLMASSKNLSRR
ncbi:hypothetical protein ACT3S9_15000 [Pseudoalteromonas sp. AOP31-A2-14]|uniref:hypothetical protein n=1 Tax=Pseudoalteromonas sp. AOP31-A2-14 TaxID=3457695 RepID=UPI004036380D